MLRTYTIKTNKTNGSAPLYTKVKRKGFKEIILNCLVEVDIPTWRRCGRHVDMQEYIRKANDSLFESKINSIDKKIKEIQKDKSIISDEEFKKTLKDAVDEIKNGEKRREAEAKRAEKEREVLERLCNIHEYVSELIQGMKRGDVRKIGRGKGEVYAHNTIGSFIDFLKVYDGFDSLHRYKFEDIDGVFYNRWEFYMKSRGFLKQTIGQFNSTFRKVINRAVKAGVKVDSGFGYLFAKPHTSEEDVREQVYLTREEVDALFKMNLAGAKAVIRDIFLVGCFTCQRVSDYARITKDNFSTTTKGNRIIKLTQKKTGTKVCVPILDSRLETILQKYDYDLPARHKGQIGRYIKDILKDLSQQVPTLKEPIRTAIPKKTRIAKGFSLDLQEIPKWKLVSTHTARRTGITLLYQSHKFDFRQLMSISGHSNVETFKRYIRLTEEETADEIAEKATNENLF